MASNSAKIACPIWASSCASRLGSANGWVAGSHQTPSMPASPMPVRLIRCWMLSNMVVYLYLGRFFARWGKKRPTTESALVNVRRSSIVSKPRRHKWRDRLAGCPAGRQIGHDLADYTGEFVAVARARRRDHHLRMLRAQPEHEVHVGCQRVH